MTIHEAKAILGNHYIGPTELGRIQWLSEEVLDTPDIQYSADVLKKNANTHILILTPQAPFITINWLRDKFGVDPSKEPCMYNQDWYLKEEFAREETLDGRWHLIRKEVLEEARAKLPDEIVSSLQEAQLLTAVTYAFTFFAWYLLKGEALWKHDFLWCSDKDHNGDRIYVGRYEDPKGVNKNGFNVHRHLELRPAYSAAPEIV